mmetsp:Transcript_75868/g.234881  ORF Transcript_75868/g.234881 Transcript_75868/m.234881 type:complete len:436 (-) Transcript_75868:196-1503(-)|eukprot:CAMPEP_0204587774 /NCGR_PEP_ID=MMETSP0661-20131031/48239_1 /ASSEMBLY_ACC=CAM_ASM_000606 /TAXON_ID=109239 /ORGANISM="Alexandrium margalefi, Strain AMGDE01CS-322" /LENGTH=435 /DNA_ID=CAMNT_0051597529 /DNA_START=122 /DNA_END=1429 /DNA_ORIENTATION=+
MGGGNSQPQLCREETNNLKAPHELQINRELRGQQRPLVERFGSTLSLSWVWRAFCGDKVKHYFITDGLWTMEFGDGSSTKGSLRIYSSTSPEGKIVLKEFELTSEVKGRMRSVCGATNYSWCLRNSEHLARYIQSGTWYSLQMAGDGVLKKILEEAVQGHESLVNALPQELQPQDAPLSSAPLYPAWVPPIPVSFSNKVHVIEPGERADNDVNIVVLGPTGAGKSSIINCIFNQRVAKVKASALSVTRQMDVYSGNFYHPVFKTHHKLNVIDSVGFCDSVIPPHEVLQIVKEYIKVSILFLSKVIIVCAGRIEAEQAAAIKNLLKWLGYAQHKPDFVFIYNKAETLECSEKTECLGEMGDLLNVDVTYGVYLPVPGSNDQREIKLGLAAGFPPRAPYHEVEDDLRALHDAVLRFRNDQKQIKVSLQEDKSSCSIL